MNRFKNKLIYYFGFFILLATAPNAALSAKSVSVKKAERKLQKIAGKKKFIYFYDKKINPLTSFLGNFHPCKVKFQNHTFACSEGAFQAAKFVNYPHLYRKFYTLSGHESWALAQKNKRQAIPNWRNVHLNVMRQIVFSKFNDNKKLKKLLLATKDSYLIEHTARDSFWGDGGNGKGQNMLGKILMEVRVQLGGKRPRSNTPPKEYYSFLKNKKGKKKQK